MIKRLIFLAIYLVVFAPLKVGAQMQKIDSIYKLIIDAKGNKNYLSDTSYLNYINDLAGFYNSVNPDSTIYFAKQNIDYCKAAKFEKGQAEAMRVLAMGLASKSEYLEAIKWYDEALILAQNAHSEKVISKIYNGLGIVFKNLGNYEKALQFHFKSLAIKEKLNDRKAIANSLGNIAIIYKNTKDYKDALEKYEQSLVIFKSLNDKQGIATALNNISSIYTIQNKYIESIKANEEALKIQDEIGDNTGKAFSLEQIGISNLRLKKYNEAISDFEKSLAMKQAIGDKNGSSTSYRYLASVYKETKEYNKALSLINKSLDLSLAIGNKLQIANAYDEMHEIYKCLKMNDLALLALENRILYDDSLGNIEIEKQLIQLKTQYEYETREKIFIAEQQQKDLINDEKLKKQFFVLLFTILLVVIASIFIVLTLRSRKKLEDAYHKLEKANNEIALLNDGLNEKVKERTQTLEKANEKLKKYSFTNNHVIRKPIANILGIIKLFNSEKIDDPINITSLELLKETTKELDEIIHEINKNLENESKQNK